MFDFGMRNLAIFFKDKMTVLLSFLAEFIMVGLYLLFLRDNLLTSFPQLKNAKQLMDIWMIAGVLGVASATTTMGAYGVMIDDKVKKINKDFYTAPVHKYKLLGGYLFSAVVIGLFMSLVILMISELYVINVYGIQLCGKRLMRILAILALCTIANSSLVLFFVSFLRSNTSLAACCTIIGALMGFLTGIYLPMGSLPESVQWIIKVFPVSHGVVLLRQELMKNPILHSFGNASAGAQQFREFMGVELLQDGKLMTATDSIVILIVTAVVFGALTTMNFFIPKRTK